MQKNVSLKGKVEVTWNDPLAVVKRTRREGGESLDFSVLVPGGVTMCTQQCTSDGNSTWWCHH